MDSKSCEGWWRSQTTNFEDVELHHRQSSRQWRWVGPPIEGMFGEQRQIVLLLLLLLFG
jgi:hypothetical protein